jgi:predicted RNA binding protein YcfA (HicA-like mRNA interferase family)
MSIQNSDKMKYREFHKKIEKEGWKFSHAEGSHYFYLKNGKLSPPIPFHGAKEMGEGLRRKLIKEMGLK